MVQICGPLMVGARGEEVKTLQAAVRRAVPAVQLQVDGIFGAQTESAVRMFQRAEHLRCDGIVGPVTAAALGLAYVARERLPAFAEITRRHVRGALNPGEHAVDGHEPQHSRLQQEAGAVGVLAEAAMVGFSLIHGRVKRKLKTTGSSLGEKQKPVEAILRRGYGLTIASVGLAAGAAAGCDSQAGTILGRGIEIAGTHYSAALMRCGDRIADFSNEEGLRQFSVKLGWTSSRLSCTLPAVSAAVRATLSGRGHRLDAAVGAIISSMATVL